MNKVSILIPCYNAESWIGDTLRSAQSQTWKDKEIIVVDDGSADGSVAAAQPFESASIKVVRQEHRGASAARNRALALAQGDYLQFLDADDLLGPEKIEKQVYLLERVGSGHVASGRWARFFKDPSEAQFHPEPVWADFSPVEWLICCWEGGGMMHPAAWLVPRSVANQAGGWDERFGLNDDGEYFCRVLLSSRGVKFCPEARSYYRSGLPGSLATSKSPDQLRGAFQTFVLCAERLLQKEDSPRTRQACAQLFQRFIFYIYPAMPELVGSAEAKVRSYGGCDIKPEGGARFHWLVRLVGWKLAIRIRNILGAFSSGDSKP